MKELSRVCLCLKVCLTVCVSVCVCCNLLTAPLQPTQLLVPIVDVAVQTTSPCEVSQDASTQTSDQQVSSTFIDVAVQTFSHGIHTSSLLSQHVSTQMGSRSASSCSVDMFVQTLIHSTVLHDVAIQLPITEFFIGCIFSNDPLDPPKLCSSVPVISTRSTCLAAATA